MKNKKFSEMIGFDRKTGQFTIGTHNLKGEKNQIEASELGHWTAQADALVRQLGTLGGLDPASHQAMAAAIIEPIQKVAPYAEIYNVLFQDVNYGELEDNSIPVEDITAVAWETHQDGAARPVRSGYAWTRPDFVTYDTSIELPWDLLRKAGWNVFGRQMIRATEQLAKKRDERALGVYLAALLASHVVTISGGVLTKASLDSVVRQSADIGFPVTRAIVNPGTIKDMADFVWPVGVYLPDTRVEQLIQTQFLTNYAGVDWYTNPYFPTNRVRFAGAPAMVGWHQTRGNVRSTSDMDLINKRDLYLLEDQEHAWYIGNELTLWEIRINP